jgi:hypothetical protein
LILLNTDKLEDVSAWTSLHEKVVTAELVLDPSPAEAFDVAVQGKHIPFSVEVRAAIAALKVSNIRVIERVLATIHHIVESSGGNIEVAPRWIPSTVLMTASHYGAVNNAPPLEYIKAFNGYRHLFGKKNEERNPKEIEWDAVLERLNIKSADEFESILQNYLQSGILDSQQLKIQFEKYNEEAIHASTTLRRNEFFRAVWWDPHVSNTELLQEAKELLVTVNVIGPDAISDLVSTVEELGDGDLAKKFLDDWLASLDLRPEYQNLDERPFESPHRSFHPKVIEKLNAMRDQQHPPLPLIDVVERIVQNSGWGDREKIALRNSSVTKYEDAIREVRGDTLRRFFGEHIGWLKSEPYDENFKIGATNFVRACANIYTAEPNSRLSKMIHSAFEAQGLNSKLSNEAH